MHALNVSRRSFSRWVPAQDSSLSSNPKGRGRKMKIDSFDNEVIKSEIHKMLNSQQAVTLKKSFLENKQRYFYF